jgi:hypothetical protein
VRDGRSGYPHGHEDDLRTSPVSLGSQDISTLLDQYGCGPIQFAGTGNALYERHLLFDNVIDLTAATPRLTAEQAAASRGWYNPRWHYENEPETRAALDLISSDHFSRNEPGVFTPLCDTLLTHGDFYMHLADLTSYLQAHEQIGVLYADPDAWAQNAILNVASAGRFSSDRTIAEYAADIWKLEPCPVR